MANFLDLCILSKLGPDTTMNSFCTEIGSSFFETAAYFGTMQTKGLVRIEPGVGRSVVNATDTGKEFLQRALAAADEPLDELDHSILRAIAHGARSPEDVEFALNVFEDDIAVHLWRLMRLGYITASVANVKVALSLTESGFKLAGTPIARASPPLEPAAPPVPPSVGPPLTLEERMKEAIVREPDITATFGEPGPGGEEEIEFTPLYVFRAKLAHYARKFVLAIAVAAAAVIAILALRALGYI